MKIRLHADTVIDGDVTFEAGDAIDLNGYRFVVSGTMRMPPEVANDLGFPIEIMFEESTK